MVDGFPLPSIVWIHNGTEIPSDDSRITDEVSMDIERTSTFSVTNTSLNDSGEYACIAVSPAFASVGSDLALILIQGQLSFLSHVHSLQLHVQSTLTPHRPS